MKINSIEIFNFRHLDNQQVEFDKDVALFSGKNGEGKTSFLEAIYLLAHGKSFKKSSPNDFINWSSKEKSCSVIGKIEDDISEKEIRYEVVDGKRLVFLNETPIKRAKDFFGQFRAISFTPSDLEVIKGPPTARRRFLDRVLAMVEDTYVESLVNYQRALKQRNSILQGGQKDKDRGFIDAMIKPWTEVLIEQGLLVASFRSVFVREIEEATKKFYKLLLKNSNEEKIKLELKSCFLSEENTPIDSDKLRENFKSNLDTDLKYKNTGLGIQRDDILIYIDTGYGFKDARQVASQGQARSLALALELAAVEYIKRTTGDTPVILLDDVESELDDDRKRSLYSLLPEIGSQVIISSTEASKAFTDKYQDSEIFTVKSGKISKDN